jgi:hypothetical protein
MATESRPTTATMSLENYLMRAGVTLGAATSAAQEFPLTNLLNPLRGEPWRGTSLVAQQFDIDLGTSLTPGAAGGIRVFALVNYNGFPAGFDVKLQTITGIGGSVVSTWTYQTYVPASVNRVMRWFVGNHDGAAAGASSRYVRVTLPAAFGIGADYVGSIDTFTQVGVVWLGDYVEIGYDKGAKVRLVDPSIEGRAKGGSAYHDKQQAFHEVDLKVPLIQASTLYPTLKERLDIAGGTTRLLLDMHSVETSDYWRAHGAYYGRLDLKGGSEQSLSFTGYGDLKLSFAEDPA